MSKTIDQLVSGSPAAAMSDTDAIELSQSSASVGGLLSQLWTWINTHLSTVATSGSASDLNTGTLPRARFPAPTTVAKGGVFATTPTTHQFLTGLDGSGTFAQAQPAFTDISGTATATQGGTGLATYAVGDLLYASSTTALSKLADVATGNVLISGGVTTAPAWGKVTLTGHVSGALPVANGGAYIGGTSYGDVNQVLTAAADAPFTSLSASLTANRTRTLPLANTMQKGARITQQDAGGIVGGFTLTVQRQGSDLLFGVGVVSNAFAMAVQFGSTTWQTDGVSNWFLVGKV